VIDTATVPRGCRGADSSRVMTMMMAMMTMMMMMMMKTMIAIYFVECAAAGSRQST
jgi:hypothetical protein